MNKATQHHPYRVFYSPRNGAHEGRILPHLRLYAQNEQSDCAQAARALHRPIIRAERVQPTESPKS